MHSQKGTQGVLRAEGLRTKGLMKDEGSRAALFGGLE